MISLFTYPFPSYIPSEMAPWLASDSLLSSQIDNGNGNQGTLYKQLKSKNDEELKKLQDKIEDAQTNLGETELSDALRAKASYLAKIGEKVGATIHTDMRACRSRVLCFALHNARANDKLIHTLLNCRPILPPYSM